MPTADQLELKAGQSALYFFNGRLNEASSDGAVRTAVDIEGAADLLGQDSTEAASQKIEAVAESLDVPVAQILAVLAQDQPFIFTKPAKDQNA